MRFEQPADTVLVGVEPRAADDCHEPARHAVERLERQRALAFRRRELHARDQAAQVPIPFRAFAEERQDERCVLRGRPGPFLAVERDRQFRANQRPDACGTRSLVEAGDAVHAVAIEQRNRVVAEFRCAVDDRLGKRRALQEAEGRCGMQFDVRHGALKRG
jgi:hypothetical protein